MDKLSNSAAETLLEATFNWLIQPTTPIAVRVNCLDILLYFSGRFAWVSAELELELAKFAAQGTGAMKARAKQVSTRLQKLKNC